MNEPLVAPLTSSPFRVLRRLRLGARDPRALVLIDRDDTALLEPPPGQLSHLPYPAPRLLGTLGADFARSAWVSLTERYDWADLPARHDGGTPRPPQRHEVCWQVIDPVAVVRSRLTEDAVPRWIANDICQQGVVDEQRQIPSIGVSYRITRQSADLSGPGQPSSWDETYNYSFRFYRDLVTNDPAGLAALWLLHHPDQAEHVLNWTVAHRNQLTAKTRDELDEALASLLHGLSPEDRALVGVNMASLLSDLGVEQAQDILNQMRPPVG